MRLFGHRAASVDQGGLGLGNQTWWLVMNVALVGGLIVTVVDHGFFWDTIQLASKHAHHYYESGFREVLLPDEIDSGHIPAFGMYIALCWFLLGKTLVVSHLAMLPFALGCIYYMRRVAYHFCPEGADSLTFLLLIHPVMSAQLSLVSPDVVLVFALFMGIDAWLKDRKVIFGLAIALLFLISMRGMMAAAILGVVDLIYYLGRSTSWTRWVKFIKGRVLVYLPALLIFVIFNGVHFYEKGWIGFHSSSPWSTSFEPVGLSGVVYNIGLLAWRLLDFGGIAIFVLGGLLILLYGRHLWAYHQVRRLCLLTLAFALLLPLSMIWASQLIGHRYLLPIMLLATLMAGYTLMLAPISIYTRRILIVSWILITLTGHLWVYPKEVAQGWDASLAYLPYHGLRLEALNYMEVNGIPVEETGTFFPNINRIDHIDLNGDQRAFLDYEGVDTRYVFYSTVYNVSDVALERMSTHCEPLQSWSRGRIEVALLICEYK